MNRVVWTAFRSLTLLAGHRKRHRVTKSWSMRYLQQCLGQTQPSTPPPVGHQKEYQHCCNQSRRCWSSLWWFVHYGKVQAKCAIPITGVQAGCSSPFLRLWACRWTNRWSLGCMANGIIQHKTMDEVTPLRPLRKFSQLNNIIWYDKINLPTAINDEYGVNINKAMT